MNLNRNLRPPRRRPLIETIGCERQAPTSPVLRFAPTAWAKLLFFRDRGDSEIGGFGIAACNDLLRIEEFSTVKQEATVASVAFDDLAVAGFFEMQVDEGRKPEQFARIWLHTHPGNSPQPSGTDEETFRRVFGRCDWAVMFILARDGQCYARLRFNTGPGGQLQIPVEVDYSSAFGPSAFAAWEAEYLTNVTDIHLDAMRWQPLDDALLAHEEFPDEWFDELASLSAFERRRAADVESEARHE